MNQTQIHEGDTVVRVQGRETDIGRRGVVAIVHPDVVGGGGDILLTIMTGDVSWHAYDRQVKVVRP
jgi:hypothetical protein